jgi:WXG100 family type VII secretion target
MATYNLDPNGLLDTSSELSGITASIQNAIDQLNPPVNALIQANAGGARDAYRAAQAQWNMGIEEMRSALSSASTSLDNIHDTYKLGDAHGAALFGGHV